MLTAAAFTVALSITGYYTSENDKSTAISDNKPFKAKQISGGARAFRRGGASCLLAVPFRDERVDHFSYSTRTRSL